MDERLHLLRLRTPEGAEFTLHLASPVLRMAALFIDWCIIMATWSTCSMLFGFLGALSADLAGWIFAVFFFSLNTGYDIACEYLWRGQSVGKRVMRLRVVDAAGLSLRLPQVVLRNILRYIDLLPAAYLVGGLCCLLGRRAQRLGDLAAGTLVIWEAPVPQPDLSGYAESKYNSLRQQQHIVARLRQAVTPQQAQAAWMAVRRRDQLATAARVALFAEMAAHFKSVTHLPPETCEGVSDEQLVRNVVDVLYRN